MDNRLNEHDFHWKIETSKGIVNVRADVTIRGNNLTMQELSIRPESENKTGLKDEMQAARSELFNRAKEQGFTRLDVSAIRVPGSTSAKPNKEIDFSVDLTKDRSNPVNEFQPHPDPMVKYGQDANRLQALQKPYQTKQFVEISQSKQNKNKFNLGSGNKPQKVPSALEHFQKSRENSASINSAQVNKLDDQAKQITRNKSLEKAYESRKEDVPMPTQKDKGLDYE